MSEAWIGLIGSVIVGLLSLIGVGLGLMLMRHLA